MKRIALTGGAAEGKSTILAIAKAAGVDTISSDDVVRELWGEDSIQAALRSLMGREAPIAPLDVRPRFLSDPLFRRGLNAIFHRPVYRRLMESSALVLEVPLLIETCLQRSFDRVWVVTCGHEEQMNRLISRFGNQQAAQALLATQLNSAVRVSFADRVFRTNKDPSHVQSDVLAALSSESLI